MSNFVILTDSSCDLEKALREQYEIEYVHMRMSCEGKDYAADLDWLDISEQDFYNAMREGKRFMTAQVTAVVYEERFEQYAAQGKDVLYIACSSALSASAKASELARAEVLSRHPDTRIVIVDTLCAGKSLGILNLVASELRAQGRSIDEVAAWVEANRKNVHQEGTVQTLEYLKRAGRVKAAAAFFGGLLNIKPIIISDTKGNNLSVEKVKGRKTSLVRLAERVAERYEPREHTTIHIEHAECAEDAEAFRREIESRIPDATVRISPLGPILGASCGPGMIVAYFMGRPVTDC